MYHQRCNVSTFTQWLYLQLQYNSVVFVLWVIDYGKLTFYHQNYNKMHSFRFNYTTSHKVVQIISKYIQILYVSIYTQYNTLKGVILRNKYFLILLLYLANYHFQHCIVSELLLLSVHYKKKYIMCCELPWHVPAMCEARAWQSVYLWILCLGVHRLLEQWCSSSLFSQRKLTFMLWAWW